MIGRWAFTVVLAVSLSVLDPGTVPAQPFPSRPIRVIVPFDAGGAMDVVMRLVGKKVSDLGGPQIIVENKTGGGGVIGVMSVRDASPDGYTLVEGSSSTHVLNPHLMANFPYDQIRDFQPITMLVKVPQILAVPAGMPVNSVADLLELASKKPGGLSYGSAGVGSAPHITAALMAKSFGTPMTHVPYRGMASALTDLLAGRIDFVFGSIPSFQGHTTDGKLKLLAVAGDRRLKQLPQIPSMAEVGHPTVELDLWFGLLAPAGIPGTAIQTLNALFVKAANQPDLAGRFTEMGLEIATGTPDQLRKAIEAENTRLGPFVRELVAQPK